jgi:Mg-chelatase subunit ChlD
MFLREKDNRHRRRSQRGAIAVLIAVSLPMLVVVAAVAVNVAYMEMVRTQLRISCDSAAKAALVNFGATSSQTTARSVAQTVANNNLVAGAAVTFPAANIVFGNSTRVGSSSVFTFTAAGTPTNSVQVTATVTANLFLKSYLPVATFTTAQTATATRISHDIVLVLDRSASMAFDLTANEFEYPPNTAASGTPLQCYFMPPDPTASRWAALTTAVSAFITTLQARNLDVHLGLVTYSETYSFGNYSAAEATLDVPLTSNYTATMTAMNSYGQGPLLGDTNISAGLTMAQTALTGSLARATADRTIILLTDGVPTEGNLNIASVVQSIRTSSDIVTHVITFSAEAASGSNATMMQDAAADGNGMYFNAPTAAQLQQAFQDIADSLPAVLTD